MGLIQNLIKGIGKDKKEFKEKFKQVEEDYKIHKIIEERQKSSNERELEAHFKEQREAQIKVKLDKVRKERNKEFFTSKNNILSSENNILKDDYSVIKGKNIFKGNENQFSRQHSIKHNTDMGFWK